MRDLLGHAVGYPASWVPDDAVLYAAAVGADLRADLDYLDLSRGLKVLPTILGARVSRSGQDSEENFDAWEFEPHDMLTLSCDMTFVAELPAAAVAECAVEYVELWDKGSSAIAVGENNMVVDGHAVGRVRATIMFQGSGASGVSAGPPVRHDPSSRCTRASRAVAW